MRLYFVRHGESEANTLRQFSTRNFEIHPLTDKGRQQTKDLAEKLRDVKFNEIYSGPLLRARQSAEILNAPHGLEIQITPALNENGAGDLEGRADPEAWGAYRMLFEGWIAGSNLDAHPHNCESFNDMRARFVPFVETLVEKHAGTNANILMVAHGGILHTMLPVLLSNVTNEFGYKHLLGNAALVEAEQTDGGLHCLSWDGVGLTPDGRMRE